MSFHSGLTWCRNADCTCGKEGPVCPGWEGYPEWVAYEENDRETWPAKWCPRCGWEREDHPIPFSPENLAIYLADLTRIAEKAEANRAWAW